MSNILETILWWLVSGVDPGLPVSQPPAPRLVLWRWWMRSPWRKILKWGSSFGSVSLTCSVQSLDPSSDEDPRSCRTSRSEESARPRRYPWESCHRTPSEKQNIIWWSEAFKIIWASPRIRFLVRDRPSLAEVLRTSSDPWSRQDCILQCDWLILVTWLEYSALIGQYLSSPE